MSRYRQITLADAWRMNAASNRIQGIRSPTGLPADDVLLGTWSSEAGTALLRPNGEAVAVGAATVTWANRPTNPSLYDQIFVTDIGPNGTQFWWNGSRWKVLYPSVIGENGNIVTGVAQIADQYLGAGFGPFPVGLLQVGDTFCYQFALGKDAALDTYGTATSIRFGQNGTVVDVVIAGINLSGVIVAASRAGPGFEKYFRVVSANTIRPIGVISAVSSFNGLSVGNTDAATTVGIINITTTPWRIGVSTNMNAGTAAPQITYQRLTLLP